ncbi:MAG: discoidin domain-containing protein, partial [Thermoanaerobaculia bacterium]
AMIPNASGTHNSCFTGATNGLKLQDGDVLFAYVLIDPCNPPREVMLEFHDGTNWNYRAFWGENLIPHGSDQGPSRLKWGLLPDAGQWVRLEVPVSVLGMEGKSVHGVAFTIYDGRAWFDRMGKYSRVNVALNKTATQSSVEFGQEPWKAVDGDFTTINHTASNPQAWFEVDLGSVMPVENVVLRNRLDSCCIGRLNNYSIFLSETPFVSKDLTTTINQQNVFRYNWAGSTGDTVTFTMNRPARYVRLQLHGTNNLNIREMQVYATAARAKTNIGGGTRTSASTSYDSWTPTQSGVDGHFNDRPQSGSSIFHTKDTTATAWWETDLHAVKQISTIELIRRIDNYDSIFDYYVLVSDVPFASTVLADVLAQPGVSAYFFKGPIHKHIPINRTGRFVRVQKASGYFGFAEMRIWSHDKPLGVFAVPETPAEQQQ